MLGHVNRCRSSSEVWFTLARLNATQSKARSLQLKFLLQTTKKRNQSIEDYILKMKNLADNHNQSGQTISDEELILYILGGVGPEYESVVVNLTSRQDDLNLQEVQFMLQSQEMRIESMNALSLPDNSDLLSAHYAAHGSTRSGFNGGGRT